MTSLDIRLQLLVPENISHLPYQYEFANRFLWLELNIWFSCSWYLSWTNETRLHTFLFLALQRHELFSVSIYLCRASKYTHLLIWFNNSCNRWKRLRKTWVEEIFGLDHLVC